MLKGVKGSIFCIGFLLISGTFSERTFAQTNDDSGMRVDTSYHLILEPYLIPLSDVSIIPPAYYKPFTQDGKFGFIHQGAASTLQVQIVPGTPYTYIAESLTQEELGKQGAVLLLREEVLTNDNKPAILMVLSFTIKKPGQEDAVFERMMLLTGDHTRAVWVNANYPAIARPVLYNVLRESLLSIKF